jgi:hypothetical protein
MRNRQPAGAAALVAAGLAFSLPRTALADIPAGYLGKPFDPALAGGAGIIPATVKAGPYPIPGRIDLVNYDLGGDGVGYHAEAHYTTKDGDGYRTDRPTATMCLTLTTKPDLWYDTGSAGKDGAVYPSDGAQDFYIGSVHPNDWFNYTVDVKTAGTYTLSSSFATGNGPPGGEGGDGEMQLLISVNGVQQADWKVTFPDYQNKANFHNWKPYPAFAMLTLEAGLQVIQLKAPFKHLNLDYVQLDLVGGEGNTGGAGGTGGGATAGGAASTAGSTSSGGANNAGGAVNDAGATGAAGTTNVGAGGAVSANGGTGGASNNLAGSPGTAGTSMGGNGSPPPTSNEDSASCAVSFGPTRVSRWPVVLMLLALGLYQRRRATKSHPGRA